MSTAEQNSGRRSVSPASSSAWTESPPRTDLLPFTFGVEIECLFALTAAADDVASSHWLNIPDANLEHEGHLCSNRGMLTNINTRARTVRAIQQSAMILSKRTGHQIWRFPFKPAGISYEKWHMTREIVADLRPDQYSKLPTWTNNKINSTAESRAKWKFNGLELVSRILDFPDLTTKSAAPGPAIAEIRKFYDALSYKPGDDFLFISELENAGFHMHVGLAPLVTTNPATGETITTPRQIDIRVLQHLAYITIEYERVISLLHHPQRRGFIETKTDSIAVSNRMGIQRHAHTCGLYEFPALAYVQSKIFDKNMTANKLSDLMSWDIPHMEEMRDRRARFINWTNIASSSSSSSSSGAKDDTSDDSDDKPSGKSTIEFRQHAGTSVVSDIEHWIIFVASLVRAAEYQARHYPTPPISPMTSSVVPANLQWSMGQGKKYSTRYESEDRMMDELFDLLRLKPSERKYWRARATKYKGDEYTKFDWYEACPECVERIDFDQMYQTAQMDRDQVNRLDAHVQELTLNVNRLRRRMVRASWSVGDARHDAHLHLEREEAALKDAKDRLTEAEAQAHRSETLFMKTQDVRKRTLRIMPQ